MSVTPEKPHDDFLIPTEVKMQELERRAQGLGNGATVHEIETILGVMKREFKKANERELWQEEFMKKWWNEHEIMLNKAIQQRLQEIAKEKGVTYHKDSLPPEKKS